MDERTVDLDQFKKNAQSQLAENRNLVKKLKKLPPDQLDRTFHDLHERAFEKIDCLDCANCCKTTGPLFTSTDISRIAREFKMKPSEFEETYLRVDEDGDRVLQKTPCTFLGEDNKCLIYNIRPKACREYPHTDRKNMKQILNLTLKNTLVCPAVLKIFEGL